MDVEKQWRTADGKTIPFSQITHQHWSNIYWYHLVFGTLSYQSHMFKQQRMAWMELYERFDAKILDWKPIYNYEIEELERYKIIKDKKIIFEDKVIGDISEFKPNPIM